MVRLTLQKQVRQFNEGGSLFSEACSLQQISGARGKWGEICGRVQEIYILQITNEETDTEESFHFSLA